MAYNKAHVEDVPIVTKKIGFIGAGKVGFSLGRHIRERAYGFKVCGYYSRNPESAREAAAFAGGRAFGTMGELAAECDLLFLTVPDGQIADVWAQLLPALTDGRPGRDGGDLDGRDGGDQIRRDGGGLDGRNDSGLDGRDDGDQIRRDGGGLDGRNDSGLGADARHGRTLYIAHCSGSQDSRIFTPRPGAKQDSCIFTPQPGAEPDPCAGAVADEPAVPARFAFGSLHPLLAVHDKTTAYENLADAYFTVEGDPAFTEIAGALMTALGNHYCKIDAEQKTLYHAASVIVSNLVCALAYEGMEVFKACGLEAGFAESAWRALFLGNAENIAALGPVNALTGPIERGDTATVAKHLAVLTGDTKEIYLLLSRALIETAQKKNPERDYSELRRLLGTESVAWMKNTSQAQTTQIIISDVDEMQAYAQSARMRGETLGLVPTMGALHEGHLSLIRRAAVENDIVVVSVFVNPIQFDDPGDLAAYPKTLPADAEAAFASGADVIFAPGAREMYPEGFSTFVDMTGLSERLCGASRASHFKGVLTVVAKLFGICAPDRAYFGEKDAQQLAVVKKMAIELNMGLEIIGCPTVREEDGLAMSSRNSRLSQDERAAAGCLYRALCEADALFGAGERDPAKLTAAAIAAVGAEPLARLDYAELVDADTFDSPATARAGDLLTLAVYIGEIRLIDNMRLTGNLS